MKRLIYVIFAILLLASISLLIYYYLLTHNYLSLPLSKALEQAKKDCKQTTYSFTDEKTPNYIFSLLTKAGVTLGPEPGYALPENIKYFDGGLISETKYCYFVAFGTNPSDGVLVYEDNKGNLKKVLTTGIKEK